MENQGLEMKNCHKDCGVDLFLTHWGFSRDVTKTQPVARTQQAMPTKNGLSDVLIERWVYSVFKVHIIV